MYYLKHCCKFVWNIQLKVRVKWHIWHEAKPSAIFVTRPSPRAVHFIQTCNSASSVLLHFTLTKWSFKWHLPLVKSFNAQNMPRLERGMHTMLQGRHAIFSHVMVHSTQYTSGNYLNPATQCSASQKFAYYSGNPAVVMNTRWCILRLDEYLARSHSSHSCVSGTPRVQHWLIFPKLLPSMLLDSMVVFNVGEHRHIAMPKRPHLPPSGSLL